VEGSPVDAVTGVGGFSGRHIARRLVAAGRTVVNLTGHPERRTEFGEAVRSHPLSFDDPPALERTLEGADTLFNTYWIRFARGGTSPLQVSIPGGMVGMTFERAVRNSIILINAAKAAGVRRIVHLSITNPSPDLPLPYFAGKAQVEEAIRNSGLGYAILRPAVIFGDGGILINNIAWFLRRLPVFAVPGSGEYRLQPVAVEDLAAMAVESAEKPENLVIDAVGPEVFTFNELVKLIARTVRSRSAIMHVPPGLALVSTGLMGLALRDVVLTRDEIEGLAADLLFSNAPPTCPTKLSEWLQSNAGSVGRIYLSELRKHYR